MTLVMIVNLGAPIFLQQLWKAKWTKTSTSADEIFTWRYQGAVWFKNGLARSANFCYQHKVVKIIRLPNRRLSYSHETVDSRIAVRQEAQTGVISNMATSLNQLTSLYQEQTGQVVNAFFFFFYSLWSKCLNLGATTPSFPEGESSYLPMTLTKT